MSTQIIEFLEIICDYPGCWNRIFLENKYIEEYPSGPNIWPDEKSLQIRGWTISYFSGSFPGFIVFCERCKAKELPADIDRKEHHCLYMSTKKNGEPSDHGKYGRCVICDGIRDDYKLEESE